MKHWDRWAEQEAAEHRPPPGPILTQADLASAGCSTPNCGHDHAALYMTQACHPGAGVEVRYVKATGLAEVMCRICRGIVCRLLLASEPPR